MTSIIKQLLINKLDIPTDLFDKIKGFCFYDRKSWETIQFIRYKKELINDIFKNHTISRANPSDWFDDNNNDEHWVFCIDTPEDIRCQFQSANCLVCGNYIQEYVPERIKCSCSHDELWDTDGTDGTDW
jgi:hypothetical protein